MLDEAGYITEIIVGDGEGDANTVVRINGNINLPFEYADLALEFDDVGKLIRVHNMRPLFVGYHGGQ